MLAGMAELSALEMRYIAAWKECDGDEQQIERRAKIHPTQQRNIARRPMVAVQLTALEQGWRANPTEQELLAEILVMARKANATGEYTSSIKSYEAYGRRAFGWRNEQRTELTGVDGGPIEISAVRERLIACLTLSAVGGERAN